MDDVGSLVVRGLMTGLTMVAFAANSLLCRLALGDEAIDPASFTAIRLGSGALALLPILLSSGRRSNGVGTSTTAASVEPAAAAAGSAGSWTSAAALFAYAIAFSLAYVSLSTGTGALILFGSVQVTMLGAAVVKREPIGLVRWAGSAVAFAGLVYLVLPGVTAPSPTGAGLMAIAGVAWGVYSLRGRGAAAPARMTAGNFLRASPMALVVVGAAYASVSVTPSGVLLALVSGVVTSGLGYVLWYRVLRQLSASQASVVQLLVPVLAALGGIVVLDEEPTLRLALATVMVVGGVAAAVVVKKRR